MTKEIENYLFGEIERLDTYLKDIEERIEHLEEEFDNLEEKSNYNDMAFRGLVEILADKMLSYLESEENKYE